MGYLDHWLTRNHRTVAQYRSEVSWTDPLLKVSPIQSRLQQLTAFLSDFFQFI